MSQEQTILLRTLIDRTGGVYNPSGASLSAGQGSSLNLDVNNNVLVSLGSLISGEDLANNVLVTETRYTPQTISTAATISILKSSGGFIHTLVVGMNSCPTTTIYDNASGASGTILAHIEPTNTPRSYVVDVSFVNGATAYLTAGNSPRITVNSR